MKMMKSAIPSQTDLKKEALQVYFETTTDPPTSHSPDTTDHTQPR